MKDGMWVEVRVIREDDLEAFAAGTLDTPTREAIEAYLLHHPDVARRIGDARRAGRPGKPLRRPRR